MPSSVEYNLKSSDFATSFVHILSLTRLQYILQFAVLMTFTEIQNMPLLTLQNSLTFF